MPEVTTRPHEGRSIHGLLAVGGCVLLVLAWGANLGLGLFTFYFDPDDFPGSYYEQRIPLVVAALSVTVVLYLAAAAFAGFAARYGGGAAVAGWTVISFVAIGLLLLAVYGGGGLEATIRFANTFPG